MTFLAPWAGALAAAIGLPIVLLLYLLKLRRKALRISSTMLWEQAVKDLHANEPFRRLKSSLLLILQLLAVLAIAGAIARPAARGGVAAAGRAVLLVDVSASMNVRDDDKGTRLDVARRAARAAIDDLARTTGRDGERPMTMLVALGQEARALTGFTSSPGELRAAIDGIGPTDEPLNIDAASAFINSLTLAPTGTTSEASDPARRERTAFRLFTDGGVDVEQLRAELTLNGSSFGVDSLVDDPDGAAPLLTDNVGIIAFSARRQLDDPALVRVFVRIANATAAPVRTTLTHHVDNGTPRGIALDLPAATVADNQVQPGEVSQTFELRHSGTGLLTVSLARADALESDNIVRAVLEPLRSPRLVIIAPAARADGFLLSALGAAGIDSPTVLSAEEYEADPSGASNGADVLVFDRVSPRTSPQTPSLIFGAQHPALQAQGAEPTRVRSRVISWKRSHPVMRDVTLDALVMFPAIGVTVPPEGTVFEAQQAAGEPLRVSGESLAIGTGRAPGSERAGTQVVIGTAQVARRGEGPTRHVVVGFALERTNWGPHESFPIFVQNAVEWLSGVVRTGAARFSTTGAPGEERVGVYTREEEGEELVVPVNLLSEEETLAVRKGGGYGGVGAGISGRREGKAGSGGVNASNSGWERELWHWFAALALVLMSVEWVVYAWRSRV